ncbi:MAG: hypothetical protein V8R82_06905 [Clostridia bacterium]
MKKEKVSNFFIIIAIILFFLSVSCIGMGFNKMLNYRNSNTSYYSKSVNAYVGGDAYNYIINACYFTGYVSLGGCLLIVSSNFVVSAIKNSGCDEKKGNHSI